MNTSLPFFRHPNCASRNLELSLPFSQLVDQVGLTWLPDFIWHHQSFAHFKEHLHQIWHFELHQSLNLRENRLLITCYSEQPSGLASGQVLERILIKNFDFPVKQLTVLYHKGICSLPEEETGMYARAN